MTPETGNLQTMADITTPLAPVVSQAPWVPLLTVSILVIIIAVIFWQLAHRTHIMTKTRLRWRLHRLQKQLRSPHLETNQRRTIAKQLAKLTTTNALPNPFPTEFHEQLQQAQYSRHSIDKQTLTTLIQQCQQQVRE